MRGPYRHIVFDLDGTLVDTHAAVLRTWQRTLRDYDFEAPEDKLDLVLGVTTEAGLEALGVGPAPGFAEKWVENYGLFCMDARLFDGITETLLRLRENGLSLGVVSSRPRIEYEQYFPVFGLEQFIERTVLADDTERHKPDPQPLLRYAELAGTHPAECVYVGDAATDMECAVRAGTGAALAVWNGSGIVCPQAQFILSSPSELCGALGIR